MAPAGASACSCADREPREKFKAADAAMVGVLEERREPEQQGEYYSSADPVTLVFRVEHEYKAALGERIEVRTARDGASCGIEADVGERIGLYLTREDDGWASNLCAQAPPEEIRMAAQGWPRAAGRGRLSFLVTGRFGRARIVGLGRRGRVLAYGRGRGLSYDVAVCPGSRRSVELFVDGRGHGLAVRSLRTLRVVRTVRLPTAGFGSVTCSSEAAGRAFVAFGGGDEQRFGLLRIDARRVRTVARGTEGVVGLEPLSLFIESRRRLSWISPADGRRHALARLPENVWSAAASPDGRRIAVLTVADDMVGRIRPTLWLLDWQGNVRARRRMAWEPDSEPGVVWLDGTRLALTRHGSRAQLFGERLRQLKSVSPFSSNATVLGGSAYGLLESALLRWDPNSNVLTRVRRLPWEQSGRLVAVPAGPHVTSPARTAKRRCR